MEAIERVKKGQRLGKPLLEEVVGGYLAGTLSRQELTEFLRAVCRHGLSDEDTVALTEVMLESGETLSFKPREYPYADKHSTGGVADSTTLIVAPIVAAAGVPFLKMSGRKLGHTGGTIDKLECFRGLRTEISIAEAERIVDKVGAAVIAQSGELVPADKALYKLRDETDTVKSLPLIASSVVSKKLASGADVLVLDVKTGEGAFMEDREEGAKLARLMVRILHDAGKRAAAFLTDMNSPLGEGIGSVMEVIDAIEVLEGKEGRLRTLALALAAKIISLAKGVPDDAGKEEATRLLSMGAALAKLREIVAAQGGALDLFDRGERAKILSKKAGVVRAEKSGYVEKIRCVALGNAARAFEAAGGYGIVVPVKVGDFVRAGEPIATLYGESPAPDSLCEALSDCFLLSEKEGKARRLVYEILE